MLRVPWGHNGFSPLMHSASEAKQAFDATLEIPGTAVTVEYPSAGFYGHGAEAFERDALTPGVRARIDIEPTADYEDDKGSEFVTLSVIVKGRRPEETDLQAVVNGLGAGTMEADAAAANGTERKIRGRAFFLFAIEDDVASWSAVTLLDGAVAWIEMTYALGEGEEPAAAHARNGRVFLEALEHLSFI